jgi:VanZ family protein
MSRNADEPRCTSRGNGFDKRKLGPAMIMDPATISDRARPALALFVMAAGTGGLAAGMAILAGDLPGTAPSVGSLILSMAALCLVMLLWGAAPAWSAGQLLRRPWLGVALPAWSVAVGTISWWLAQAGVSFLAAPGAALETNPARDVTVCSVLILILTLGSAVVTAAFTLSWRAARRCSIPLLLLGAPWIVLGLLVYIYSSEAEVGRWGPPVSWTGVLLPLLAALAAGVGGAAIGHSLRRPTGRRVLAAVLTVCVAMAAGWLFARFPASEAGGQGQPVSILLVFLGMDAGPSSEPDAGGLRWFLGFLVAILVLGWAQWSGLLLSRYESALPSAARKGSVGADLDPRTSRPGRVYFILTLAYAAFIIYGSLVPLDFHTMPFSGAWDEFWQRMRPEEFSHQFGRSDFVANLLLGIPLAFFSMGFLTQENRRRGREIAALCSIAGACLVAALAEFGQLYVPERTTSLSDVIAQTMGGALGVAVWAMAGGFVTRYVRGLWARYLQDEYALKLLGGYAVCYAIYQLLPFNITISLAELYHKFRSGMVVLLPFNDRGGLTAYMLLSQAGAMIPIGYAFVVLWRGRRHPVVMAAVAGLMFAGLLECLQFFILPRYSSSTDAVMGALGGGLGGWLATLFGPAARTGLTRKPLWKAHGWWIKTALLVLWAGGLAIFRWHSLAFEWPAEGLWEHAAKAVCAPLTTFYYQSELGAATEVVREATAFLFLGLLVRSVIGPSERRGWGPDILAVFVAVSLVGGLEVGRLLLPLHLLDPASPMIETAGAVIGILLHARFVRTFVQSPETETTSGTWSST